MSAFFQHILTAGFHGSIVILAVLALGLILRGTPRKYICYLWSLAGLRLLLPIPIRTGFSLPPFLCPPAAGGAGGSLTGSCSLHRR